MSYKYQTTGTVELAVLDLLAGHNVVIAAHTNSYAQQLCTLMCDILDEYKVPYQRVHYNRIKFLDATATFVSVHALRKEARSEMTITYLDNAVDLTMLEKCGIIVS